MAHFDEHKTIDGNITRSIFGNSIFGGMIFGVRFIDEVRGWRQQRQEQTEDDWTELEWQTFD